jgi:hypothetical protein
MSSQIGLGLADDVDPLLFGHPNFFINQNIRVDYRVELSLVHSARLGSAEFAPLLSIASHISIETAIGVLLVVKSHHRLQSIPELVYILILFLKRIGLFIKVLGLTDFAKRDLREVPQSHVLFHLDFLVPESNYEQIGQMMHPVAEVQLDISVAMLARRPDLVNNTGLSWSRDR